MFFERLMNCKAKLAADSKTVAYQHGQCSLDLNRLDLVRLALRRSRIVRVRTWFKQDDSQLARYVL
jgi:hypothetical protein